MKVIHVSGTRKTAVARATLTSGSGIIRINGRLLSSLPLDMYRSKIEESLFIAGDVAGKVDVSVYVHGGGSNAQSEAVRLAIAKALSQFDKKLQSNYLDYDRAFVVADVRCKEERKPNCHGKARSKRQDFVSLRCKMIIPIRCWSCGKPVAQHWEEYEDRVKKGESKEDVLDDLGLTRYCCRAMFLGHLDLIDTVAQFKKA